MGGEDNRGQRSGALLALIAVAMWGSQFPVAKSLYTTIDPYTLTAIRYIVAVLVFLAILRRLEGARALRFDGYRGRTTVAGCLGVGLGVLVVYVGLQYTEATSAAIVLAIQPFVTALVMRLRGGPALSAGTRATIAVAFAGVVLVITKGDPATVLGGSLGWGILLVVAGQFGWVLYTIDSTRFIGWSPLRYTAMTAVPGTILVVAAAVAAIAVGLIQPTAEGIMASPWGLGYTIVGPTIVAVLTWNLARARLGAVSVTLFLNLVPVITYGIEIVRGYSVGGLELVGAALTIGALTRHNVAQMRAPRSASEEIVGPRVPAPEPL